MGSAAVEVDRVVRTFGSGRTAVTALNDVSFTIDRGQVLALLGVNGAGKTTLIKIVATLLLPSAGTVRVLGHDVTTQTRAARSVSAVIFGGDRGLYGRLTGMDNLRFFAMLAGVGRRELSAAAGLALEQVGLAAVAGRRVETYSKGMKQRLHIAIGLIARPQVLLLDEPTLGLDPAEANRLRESIADLRDQGVAILLTSHYLLDIERLADRVVLLDGGTVLENLSLHQFAGRSGYAAVVEVRFAGSLPPLDTVLGDNVELDSVELAPGGGVVVLRLRSWAGGAAMAELTAVLDRLSVVDVRVRPATLEEAFVQVSGRSQR